MPKIQTYGPQKSEETLSSASFALILTLQKSDQQKLFHRHNGARNERNTINQFNVEVTTM